MLNAASPTETAELADLTIHEAAGLVRQEKVSPLQLTQACLTRIEALDSRLNSFITVTADSALAEARQAESELRRGIWKGPLHGIPVALKDSIDTAGVRTTAASALFKDRIPREDAVVVQRLRESGAVFLGKLNMYEVAFGPTSKATSFYGRVSNPWATDRISGGSSSGGGAAVAAGLCFAAIGSDTGGSIRQPAAFCGVVGLMPSYGRVSARGTIPLSRSADYLGPMARSVVDAALVLRAIAGHDPREVTSYDMPVQDYAAALSRRTPRMRIGVAREYFFEDLDPQVRLIMDRAVSVFVKLDAEIRDVTLPISSGRTVIQAEAYAYHATSMATTPELYLPETLSKLRLGEHIDMATYIEAKLNLEQVRRAAAPSVFRDVDAVLTPTTPVPSPRATELPSAFDQIMASDAVLWRNTRPFNLLAFPTVSIPCGFTDVGLPVGLQLSGAPWQESQLLKIAHAYEQATNWNRRRPPITAGHA